MQNKSYSLRALVNRGSVYTCLIFLLLNSFVPANGQTPTTGSADVAVYVSVIDPQIVQDVFGKRIAQRFVAIQVTIANKNSNFQFLIHDVSLDLKNVFGNEFSNRVDKEATDRCESCISNCMDRTNPSAFETEKEKREGEKARWTACKMGCGRVCTSSKLRFELSSLELSLIRGVAERGQGEDKRNKILRYFRAVGTVAAGVIGIASFGPAYAKTVAIFNGPVINATSELFPDYTINQMNRLSDSAYKSNTLVPKQQAKVLVAFIPQSIFLTAKQRDSFWKDPTSLYPEYNTGQGAYPVDFRKASAVVDGSFITEIENLPPLVTGVIIAPDQALEFLKKRPEVRGYILGQFLEGANIDLSGAPEGMELTVDKDAKQEDGKLFFVIKSDRNVPRGTQLNFRVFNKQGSQTISQAVSFMPPVPTLKQPSPPLDGAPGATGVTINLLGSGFLSGVTTLVVDESTGVHVVSEGVSENPDGSKSFNATLRIDANATPGTVVKLKVKNGTTVSNVVDFTIK